MPPIESLAKVPGASALTRLIDSASLSENPLGATTIQILHNLQHQHLWTSLQIHDISIPPNDSQEPVLADTSTRDQTCSIISGIPPQRTYIHPDEQFYLLEKGLREDHLKPERAFVIPTAQGQKWTLRRIAGIFDALPNVEVVTDSESSSKGVAVDPDQEKKLAEYYERKEEALKAKEWGSKRMLLAMVDKGMGGDGTVVYYVVQEGEVKPRQN